MNAQRESKSAPALLFLLACQPAVAGGLYLTEFGDPSQGAAGAGAGALAQDASTAAHNPAAIMALEPRKNHWMVTAMYVDPTTEFGKDSGTTVRPTGDQPGGNGGDAGVSAWGGAFFWARPVNEQFGFGFALNSEAAATLSYESDNPRSSANNFVGRYWATKTELLTVNATPSFAWRINDSWSLGFAVPIQLGRLDLNVAVPTPPGTLPATDGNAVISNGQDVSATVSLSMLWEPSKKLKFGALYRGENELNFNGDLEVSGPRGTVLPTPTEADVSIPFVQTLRLWNATGIGERFTVLTTLAWEDWSSFDNLLVQAGDGGSALPRNWKDTWKIALGLRWQTAGAWTHHFGTAYDTSPVDASDRSADMPIDRQWRLSAGTNYLFDNGMSLGGVVTFADYGAGRIDNGGSSGQVVGEYDTNQILFVGLNLGW